MGNQHNGARAPDPPEKIIPLNPYEHPGARWCAYRILRDLDSLTQTMAEAVDFYGLYDPVVVDGLALIDTWEHYAMHLETMLESA